MAAGLFPERLYVPNGLEGTVDEIDPSTFQVVKQIPVGSGPQHVIPSWDMKRLYVLNTGSNTITQLDPSTGGVVRTIDVPGADNLYWTIDGKTAVVVGENLRRVDFRDPNTFRLIKSVQIPGSGPNHLDFSGDGSFMVATSELDGKAFRIDTKRMAITGELPFPQGSRPVDVMLVPEAASMPSSGSGSSGGEGGMAEGSAMGSSMGYLGTSTEFFVADQGRDGVAVVEAAGQTMRQIDFIPTGRGAHGFAMSHDGRTLYVTNRLGGTVSRIDVATRKVTGTFTVGGSPDMIQVAPDGKTLWTSNRFDGTVTVLDATTGAVVRTITVGAGPHGLCMFPQPAKFSTGHCMFR
jgi:YVTN family beta-propeller protein